MFQRFAVLLLLCCWGGSADAIIGGTPDMDANSVYRYMGTMSNGFSGTPIAPNWFVTANHVAPGIGSTYTNPDGTFTVTNVVHVPNAAGDPNGLTGSVDIALVQVGGTFTHTYGYGSVPTSTASGANGTMATLVGIGGYSTGIGVAPGAGVGRTTATNTVDAVTSGTFDDVNSWAAYEFDLDDGTMAHNVVGSQNGSPREGGIAGGDSGGGWFVSRGGALPMIIAVSSGVDSQLGETGSGNTNYWEAGGIGVGADLGYYSAFIGRTVGVAPVPEPSTLAVLGIGALVVFRRRGR